MKLLKTRKYRLKGKERIGIKVWRTLFYLFTGFMVLWQFFIFLGAFLMVETLDKAYSYLAFFFLSCLIASIVLCILKRYAFTTLFSLIGAWGFVGIGVAFLTLDKPLPVSTMLRDYGMCVLLPVFIIIVWVKAHAQYEKEHPWEDWEKEKEEENPPII